MTTTRRLYFEDSRRTEFEALIVERRTFEGRPAVVLEATVFYPESGGQPWDLGTIDGVSVAKVVEEDGAIVHVVEREIEKETVAGRIDWARRFDHMQQHSGQHILSQAFIETINGETRSFHLGAESASLEIGISAISEETLDRVERRANAVVFEDREVKTYFVAAERIGDVPLRRPPKVEGTIRVVEIDGFDYSACGGTHVGRTGEIGLIKIVGWEKIRGNLRFDFVCGHRALGEFQVQGRVIRALIGRFNVPSAAVAASVGKLADDLKTAKKSIHVLEDKTAAFEARDLAAVAVDRFVSRVFEDRGPDAARSLALSLVRLGEFVAVFAARSETRIHLILARSASIALDLRPLVATIAPLVQGKGGGGPSLVEIAGDPKADLKSALDKAVALCRAAWSGPPEKKPA